jgi:catechol 2,3-dioxygenase-like lactoylglutathione lyase family enzyme
MYEGEPLTRRLHAGFAAPSRGHVDAFWRALVDAGYRDDGSPGPRPRYRPDYYGAFILDPDGNSVEAVHHGDVRRDGGVIDHLWLRVHSVPDSKRFYSTIAPVLGFELRKDDPDWVGFRGIGASCSFVPGDEPSVHVHIAFPAPDDATVREFHRVALAAGYRDNGVPGERPEYHAGYYGAYVLDPDGNNVEAVNHNRD